MRPIPAFASATLLLSLIGAGAPPSYAQSFPSRPVRFVIPYPPGGSTDPIARIVSQKLAENWRQQIVLDHRPGAGGTLATEVVAKAPPDGHTILMGSVSTLCMSPIFFKTPAVDVERDISAVTLLASGSFLLVVHPSLPVRSMSDLIALAKLKPGQLNYASGAAGGANHLAMELVKMMAGVDLVHVPYNGTGPALTNVVGGQVPIMFGGVAPLVPLVTSGKLRAIAVTTANRASSLPDVPTIAESGLSGFDVDAWYGVNAPAGIPAPIISQMSRDITRVVQSPEVKDGFSKLGLEPNSNTPEAFSKLIKADIEKWARVAKAANLRVD